MVKINEIQGDLFTDKNGGKDNLAHCVSKDLRMGKGIATIFKDRFGQIDHLKHQNKNPGEVAHLQIGDRFIFYLITKERYFEKPEYTDLYLSLVALKDLCVANKLKSVSMPKLGCGLDKLEWNMVKMYMETIFKNVNIELNVYYL